MADVADGGYNTNFAAVSERSRILGLQLRCVRLQTEVQVALDQLGMDSPASLLSMQLSNGLLQNQLQLDKSQLEVIQ